jgi:hypothetical protein
VAPLGVSLNSYALRPMTNGFYCAFGSIVVYRKKPYVIHEPHILKVRTYGYSGICGVQFHGSKALKSSTDVARGRRSSAWRSHA